MKNYITLLVVLFFSIGIKAQDRGSVLLNLYGGYTFQDKVSFDYGYVNVGDGFQWGAGLEYFVQKSGSIAINYYRMDTSMQAYAYSNWGGYTGNSQLNAGRDSGAVNYILADYTGYFDTGSTKATPYFGAGLGVGILESPNNGNDTAFAWDLKLGVKIKTSSSVSVNLQAYLQSMSESVGSSYYYTWYGPVVYSDYVSLYQFGLGAVISYDFKSNKF